MANDRIEAYAVKFFADRTRETPLTDSELEKTYRGCVIPPHPSQYPAIRERIIQRIGDGWEFSCENP